MTTRILVTTAHWEAALCCVQSHGRAGHAVDVLAESPGAPLGRSRFCRRLIVTPPEHKAEAYGATVLDLLGSGAYDVLVPVSDAAMDLLAERLPEVERHVRVGLPTPEILRLARNKARTTRFAQAHGIAVPASLFPATAEDLDRLLPGLDYPCVVKAPIGTGSTGVRVARGPEEARAAFAELSAGGEPPFLQEFVPGDFYDLMAVCERGRLRAHFAFRTPPRYLVGGTPPYAFSHRDEALTEIASRLLAALDWHGAVDLDFLRDSSGGYRLLEINPRFSGTLNFAYKLGIDLPACQLDVSLGRDAGGHHRDYRSGVLFRTVTAEAAWVAADRRRAWRSLAWALRVPARTNLYWSDPRLLRAQLGRAARLLTAP